MCFFLFKIVTCGVSREELAEKLHVIVEKDRHKFPDALQKLGVSAIEGKILHNNDNTNFIT